MDNSVAMLLAKDVQNYLRTVGANRLSEGSGGSLWELGHFSIGVASAIAPSSVEWRSVVERVSAALNRSVSEVERDITNQYVDVAFLRAAKDVIIEGSIPLDAGVKLVTSARTMIRASATTAQRLRSQISGAYSVTGDRLASEARLGHTVQGSYIIPVLMPLPRSTPSEDKQPPIDGLEIYQVSHEPAQRRVMRTFAEALGAVERVIVQPGRMPLPKDMSEIVAFGASREFVTALTDIVESPAVSSFTAEFDWAASAKAPAATEARVEIPHDASELLNATSKLLKVAQPPVKQSITGPIVEVRHLPTDIFGEVAIQTIRNGRPAEVRIRVRQEQLTDCLEWMRAARTVLVDGHIRRAPGKPLWIERPDTLIPLDETQIRLP